MSSKFTFPHVNITTKALASRKPTVTVNTNTRLFAPFVSSKGPENEVVVVENFTDFKNIYGNLDYTKLGQEQILNIGQWFSAGGVVLAFRMTQNIETYIKVSSEGNAGNLAPGTSTDSTEEGTSDNILLGYAHGEQAMYTKKDDLGETLDVKKITVYAKDPGIAFNNYKVTMSYTPATSLDKILFNITVIDNLQRTVEYKRNIRYTEMYLYCKQSDYIASITFDDGIEDILVDSSKYADLTTVINIVLNGGEDFDVASYITPSEQEESKGIDENYKYGDLIKNTLNFALKQSLETPCDVFIDPGYHKTVKQAISEFFFGQSEETASSYHRDDIYVYMSDVFIDKGKYKEKYSVDDIMCSRKISVASSGGETSTTVDIESAMVYKTLQTVTHYFKAEDPYYNGSGSREVYYPLTFFIAGLVPYWDRMQGCQKPLAGKERGFIGTNSDITWVNRIPTNIEKQEFKDNHINYIEKENDSYYIMLQDTQFINDDGEETALRSGAHVRVLLKIQRDLKSICRKFLHEENDAITKRQILNECVAYLDTYVKNRTFKMYDINIYDSEQVSSLLDKELLVTMSVKFINHVEIVDLDFTVE